VTQLQRHAERLDRHAGRDAAHHCRGIHVAMGLVMLLTNWATVVEPLPSRISTSIIQAVIQ
jgi:hypothetical protein